MAATPDADSNETYDDVVAACNGVTKIYHRGDGQGLFRRSDDIPSVTALFNVSVTIEPGEIVAIAGPSGSGKSTLLHLLAGLVTPSDGDVYVDGTNIATLSRQERRLLRLETIGIVFQHFHLLDSLSARSNVAAPLVELGIPRRMRRTKAAELLADVGLDDRITHRPTELSGGEQQRVAIARALVSDPSLLIADEPTGELDTATGETILELFQDLAHNRAVVIASHDQQVLDFADRVIYLHDGEIVSNPSR